MTVDSFFRSVWNSRNPVALLLWPVSLIYCAIVSLRRVAYASGLCPISRFSEPIIAVGNITVGGTGKTPFTIWLANYLSEYGFRPGVVSRGYGRRNISDTLMVRSDSNPDEVGDEPLVIAQRAQVPVAVAKKRSDAVRMLLERTDCDIFVCDDALQHHSLAVDLSIALVDAKARFGNGFCLPAGPLREPAGRLDSVALKLVKGAGRSDENAMRYEIAQLVNVRDNGNRRTVEYLKGQRITAVAGIADPDSFFDMLLNLGVELTRVPFPDHHQFTERDFDSIDQDNVTVVMTEKDAVKCRGFARDNWWYVAIDATVSDQFVVTLADKLSVWKKTSFHPENP
ncbi:MAG: tetraacyldisaccharide 4'-kinase [Acidiferrobacterales bacterium]|nr:tetraacyldisaccharide 4'-kinase [Acidiferrobacterales bacterium]